MNRPQSQASSVEFIEEVARPNSPLSSAGDSDDDSVECLGQFRCDSGQHKIGNNNNNVGEWVHAYWPGSPTAAASTVNTKDEHDSDGDKNHLAVTTSDGERRPPTPYPVREMENVESVEQMDGIAEQEEHTSQHLPASPVLADPDASMVAQEYNAVTNTVTITDVREQPNATVQEQWACDQAMGEVEEGRPETLVYDLVMPAAKVDPIPNECCGQWPEYCRCHVQGSSSGTRRLPTPYPDRHLIAEAMGRCETSTSVKDDDDKENIDPESGRSTSLAQHMEWNAQAGCVTPDLEYSPKHSPYPGQPPKRVQLDIKPSLATEYNPPEERPTAVVKPVPRLAITESVAGVPPYTDPDFDYTVHIHPIDITSCDGFRISFWNRTCAIVTAIFLMGVNMAVSIVSHERVALRFTLADPRQGALIRSIPFNDMELGGANETGPDVSSLSNLRMDFGLGRYAQIGGITLKGASFSKYTENGAVIVVIYTT